MKVAEATGCGRQVCLPVARARGEDDVVANLADQDLVGGDLESLRQPYRLAAWPLDAWLSAHHGREASRADAAALLGLLSGTLQLARATPDRAESDAILAAGIHAALRLAQ